MHPSALRIRGRALAGVAFVSLAAVSLAQDRIELPLLRTCAEFEPCLGTVITYPVGLPLDPLAVDLASDDTLFVFYDDETNRLEAARALTEIGVDMSNVDFIHAMTDDFYTRDFGAQQTFLPGGLQVFMDQIFWDYSLQGAGGGPVYTWGPGAFTNDDLTPRALAAHIGVGHRNFPAHMVGGNIDFDGLGMAFCTQLMLDENRYWSIGYEKFRNLVEEFYGVPELYTLPNYEIFGIQHVDCALKIVDEETLIVTRTPVTHNTHVYHEALFQAAKQCLTAYGRPYVIHRVDIPVFKGGVVNGELANYANSLIMNGKVFVPLFGIPADQRALNVYRDAMLGYEVLGYEFVSGEWPWGSWASFDALHCRTKQVFDPEMLLIKHPRIRGAKAGEKTEVRALIRAYSGAALLAGETDVQWRTIGSSGWNRAAFRRDSYDHELVAEIPAQAAGTIVEYWIRAKDGSGRVESRPPRPTLGGFEFRVQ